MINAGQVRAERCAGNVWWSFWRRRPSLIHPSERQRQTATSQLILTDILSCACSHFSFHLFTLLASSLSAFYILPASDLLSCSCPPDVLAWDCLIFQSLLFSSLLTFFFPPSCPSGDLIQLQHGVKRVNSKHACVCRSRTSSGNKSAPDSIKKITRFVELLT